jgi:hypothetical protein
MLMLIWAQSNTSPQDKNMAEPLRDDLMVQQQINNLQLSRC